MKTQWDYTDLAQAYLKRPEYSEAAVEAMLAVAGIEENDRICDVGAGVAHLTLMLAARGLEVVAVEPNDSMRALGRERTSKLPKVVWHEAAGEDTEQDAGSFDMVTFGSSFNVCDRAKALAETARILKPKGWFACLWNHRKLDDPIQSEIEHIIKNMVPNYGYGTRREDQAPVIKKSNLFETVVHLDAEVFHEQSVAECVEAWRSHATLARQAGERFHDVVDAIERCLVSRGGGAHGSISIPYSTNIWMARLR